jgi:ribosome-associated toxin RatA of RatAB toxin-antitoxin module
MIHIAAFFGIFFLTITGFPVDQNEKTSLNKNPEEWELRKNKNGIQVFTRNHPDSEIKEFRAVTLIEAEITKLVGIINDVEKYPLWMANCQSAVIHEVINDSTRIDYMVTAVPWPLSDRDVVFEVTVIRNADHHFEVMLTSLPDAVPLKENLIRIRNSQGRWIFRETEENRIEVIHQFFGDPEGKVPNWIVNLFIVSGPYKTLSNLKNFAG